MLVYFKIKKINSIKLIQSHMIIKPLEVKQLEKVNNLVT